MGAGSFKGDVSGSYKSCFKDDDGSIKSGAAIAFNLVWGMPPAIVFHAFMIPANNTPGDHIPLALAILFGACAILPCAATALITLVPGCIAAGVGALVRAIQQFKF